MIILGLLLLCAAGAFTGLLIAANLDGGPDYTVTLFGNDLATLNSLEIFLSGIALTLLFGLGLLLATVGLARHRRREAPVAAPQPADTVGPTEPGVSTAAPTGPATAANPPDADRPPHRRPHFGH